MLPMMNAYEQWTATPGMTGEPLDSFTLLLKFEGMGAQVRCWREGRPVVTYTYIGSTYV